MRAFDYLVFRSTLGYRDEYWYDDGAVSMRLQSEADGPMRQLGGRLCYR